MQEKILVVEDDRTVARGLEYGLRNFSLIYRKSENPRPGRFGKRKVSVGSLRKCILYSKPARSLHPFLTGAQLF